MDTTSCSSSHGHPASSPLYARLMMSRPLEGNFIVSLNLPLVALVANCLGNPQLCLLKALKLMSNRRTQDSSGMAMEHEASDVVNLVEKCIVICYFFSFNGSRCSLCMNLLWIYHEYMKNISKVYHISNVSGICHEYIRNLSRLTTQRMAAGIVNLAEKLSTTCRSNGTDFVNGWAHYITLKKTGLDNCKHVYNEGNKLLILTDTLHYQWQHSDVQWW